jgi:hypothetical protein
VAELALIARMTVGIALVLTAIWKLRNPLQFQVALRATAPALAVYAWFATGAIVVFELATAGLLMVPGLAPLGTVSAGLLIGSFTVALWRVPSVSAGCGCWREPRSADSGRALFLARNGSLLVLVLIGATSTEIPSAGVRIFGLLAGLMTSLLILELPQFGGVVRAQTGGE